MYTVVYRVYACMMLEYGRATANSHAGYASCIVPTLHEFLVLSNDYFHAPFCMHAYIPSAFPSLRDYNCVHVVIVMTTTNSDDDDDTWRSWVKPCLFHETSPTSVYTT